jgi:hypothetical protein
VSCNLHHGQRGLRYDKIILTMKMLVWNTVLYALKPVFTLFICVWQNTSILFQILAVSVFMDENTYIYERKQQAQLERMHVSDCNGITNTAHH